MTAAIFIPARFESTRFPGKPLIDIAGRPLIEWTWRAARRTGLPVYVATDDQQISATVAAFGGNAILTGPCRNGTERCFEAHDRIGRPFDQIINWQGDAPLMRPEWAIMALDRLIASPSSILVATIAVPQPWHPGAVSARPDPAGGATFARTPAGGIIPMHQGLYALRAHAASFYMHAPQSMRETTEGLEQLRWPAESVLIALLAAPGFPIRECNHPEDVAPLAEILKGYPCI